eukprot:2676495-Rhodomonas_salina.3
MQNCSKWFVLKCSNLATPRPSHKSVSLTSCGLPSHGFCVLGTHRTPQLHTSLSAHDSAPAHDLPEDVEDGDGAGLLGALLPEAHVDPLHQDVEHVPVQRPARQTLAQYPARRLACHTVR